MFKTALRLKSPRPAAGRMASLGPEVMTGSDHLTFWSNAMDLVPYACSVVRVMGAATLHLSHQSKAWCLFLWLKTGQHPHDKTTNVLLVRYACWGSLGDERMTIPNTSDRSG
ncbi:hypothetical protein EYF80_031659 [Liparis tanakae]|uniref:Uncharacterized protein n=1 Tax=Liparis tanakae TaxID=230148 RepID=A0A4Z2GX82_9TELE|nr:hypothetical protein EYF80_031659 [Liparis tanakae]